MGAFTGTAVTKPQPEPLQMQLPLPPSQCLLTLRGSAINNQDQLKEQALINTENGKTHSRFQRTDWVLY